MLIIFLYNYRFLMFEMLLYVKRVGSCYSIEIRELFTTFHSKFFAASAIDPEFYFIFFILVKDHNNFLKEGNSNF